jgi:Tol biopolymer transport system component
MVFKRSIPNKNELIIADGDGRNQQMWATSHPFMTSGHTVGRLTDKARLCEFVEDELGRYWHIAEMPVEGGPERVITNRRYKSIRGLSWLPDGRSWSSSPKSRRQDFFNWQLSRDDGAERRLTNDVNDYWRVSVTDDGSALLTSKQERPGNVFVAKSDLTALGKSPPGSEAMIQAWTPDDRLVYSALNNGLHEIWTMEADGKGQKRLTANSGNNKFPAASADGRRHFSYLIARAVSASGEWRPMAASPDNRRRTRSVQPSPDGQQVFYTSDATGTWVVESCAFEGDEPERVRDLYFYRASGFARRNIVGLYILR